MAYCFGIDHSDQTLYHAPELKKKIDGAVAGAKSVMLVGWRPHDSRYTFFDWLKTAAGEKLVLVVDAWEPNIRAFRPPWPTVFKYWDDVRRFRKFMPDWARDCVVWQDGPEHLPKDEAELLLKAMKMAFNSIVISTPDGMLEQGPLDGNPYEEHMSAWSREDYVRLGFDVASYSAGLIGIWVRNNGETPRNEG